MAKQPTRVNPMVIKKLRDVQDMLDTAAASLREGTAPDGIKFSDLYRAKNFMALNRLGEVDVDVKGPVKASPLLSRIVTEYTSKGLTPNCSIQQVLDIAGAKVLVTHKLSELGRAVIAPATDKPARAARPKAAKKTAKKAAPKAAPKAKKAAAKKAAPKAKKPLAAKVAAVRKPRAKAAAKATTRKPRTPRVQNAVEIKGSSAEQPAAAAQPQQPQPQGNPTWN